MSNGKNNKDYKKLWELYLTDYQSKIGLSTNAQMHIWQFLVTVNLAYFVGIYFLWSKENNFKIEWTICLSILILIINFLLSVIYIREHNAIKDDIDKQKFIHSKIFSEYQNDEEIFKQISSKVKTDKYSGITNYIIILFFDVFLLIPQIVILLNANLSFVKGILLSACSILIFHCFAFFWRNSKLNEEKNKCKIFQSSSVLKIIIFFITLILFIFCSLEFIKIDFNHL